MAPRCPGSATAGAGTGSCIGLPLGRQARCLCGVRALCPTRVSAASIPGGSTDIPCLSPNAGLYQGPRNHTVVHPWSSMLGDQRMGTASA